MRAVDADAALAVDLVREAGGLAERLLGDGLRTEQKTAVADLVTTADRAAERLVADHLAAVRPDDGVLGEEGSAHDGTSGRTWVIDPVDGTWNFVHGFDWWCSALALVDGESPVLGAVHHPSADRTYVGGPELWPTCNGEPLPALVDRPLAESCVTTYLHPPFHGGPVGEAFSRMIGGAATLRMLGSGTLDAMAIARGQAHVLCQHSVPAWDWLPGATVISALGGATRKVDAAGVTWSVAGVPTAVAEVCDALLG